MQDMATPCQHSRLGHHERWRFATKRQQYATRHNPFMYFRSITSRPSYCKKHVKPLKALAVDLKHRSSTRSLSYITPDLCHDAHDARCADGGPGRTACSEPLVQDLDPEDPALAGVPLRTGCW